MILILLMLFAVGCAIVGLVQLWRVRELMTIVVSVIAFLLLAIGGFTAELWYQLFGFSRGDGQVFIGYFLLGAFALGVAVLTLLAALIVLALRSRTVGERA